MWTLNPVDAVGEFRLLDSVAIWDVARSALSVLGRHCEGWGGFSYTKKTQKLYIFKEDQSTVVQWWLLLGYIIYVYIPKVGLSVATGIIPTGA